MKPYKSQVWLLEDLAFIVESPCTLKILSIAQIADLQVRQGK